MTTEKSSAERAVAYSSWSRGWVHPNQLAFTVCAAIAMAKMSAAGSSRFRPGFSRSTFFQVSDDADDSPEG
jgi:hypothetical protein